MGLRRLLILACSIALPIVAIPAHADDLFTLTNGTDTFTFTLPGSPTPAATGTACDPNFAESFCFFEVPVDLNGVTTPESINFYGASADGGLLISTGGLTPTTIVNQFGMVLYTGSISAPTFLTGNFPLLDGGGPQEYTGNFDLTIAATPEPSSVILLGTGLLGIGALWFAGAERRRNWLA